MCLLDWNIDFRGKFGAIQREYSPNPRKFYGFCTSVTVSTIPALFFL
jgi:guanine nucleotide-binding protein alpha-1 subunit